MGVSLQRGLEQLRLNTVALGPHYNEYLDTQCAESSVQGTEYMKTHARWRDNTGNRKDRVPGAARAGLFAVPTQSSLEHDHAHKEITFSHGVNYGIWLETRHHAKFAIIMQSVKAIGEDLMARLEESLARVARET
jgi:hypothetical protein